MFSTHHQRGEGAGQDSAHHKQLKCCGDESEDDCPVQHLYAPCACAQCGGLLCLDEALGGCNIWIEHGKRHGCDNIWIEHSKRHGCDS
eukprot:1160070-Pelagomonas_calceolata.AAC.7